MTYSLLRRLYELNGGLECDAIARRESERMIAVIEKAKLPKILSIWFDDDKHMIRVMGRIGSDWVPVKAIGDLEECTRRNDRAVAEFIGRASR